VENTPVIEADEIGLPDDHPFKIMEMEDLSKYEYDSEADKQQDDVVSEDGSEDGVINQDAVSIERYNHYEETEVHDFDTFEDEEEKEEEEEKESDPESIPDLLKIEQMINSADLMNADEDTVDPDSVVVESYVEDKPKAKPKGRKPKRVTL